MKRIFFLYILLMAVLGVNAQKSKAVTVIDKDGKKVTIFDVDSINVEDGTVTLECHNMQHITECRVSKWEEGIDGDHRVPYQVKYYKPRSVEILNPTQRIHLVEEHDTKSVSSITIKSRPEMTMTSGKWKNNWFNSFARPYKNRIIALYENGDTAQVQWTTSDPAYVTVSPSGDIMAHRACEDITVTATDCNGKSASLKVKASSSSQSNKFVASKFYLYFENDEVPQFTRGYHDSYLHYYATDLGIWRTSSNHNETYGNFSTLRYYTVTVDNLLTKDTKSSISQTLGIRFDRANQYYNDHSNYITNVIVIYADENHKKNPGDVVKIDGINYTIAQTLNNNASVNISEGTGQYNYIAYTKDPYLRGNETEQRYLVNHSALGYKGGKYQSKANGDESSKISLYSYDNFNNTRFVHASRGDMLSSSALSNSDNALNNIGDDDEVVKAYNIVNGTWHDVADLQHGVPTNTFNPGMDLALVCTYETYCPPAYCWMGFVDDRTPLRQLSIPGTHDSTTADVNGTGACKARTQSLGFADQFNQGVRWFDFRVDCKSGNLCHGDGMFAEFKSSYTYESALKELWECVKRNPSEMVFITESNEANDDKKNYDSEARTKIAREVVTDAGLITYEPGMTIGDCRGKILLLKKPYALYSDFGYNRGGGPEGYQVSLYSHELRKGFNNALVSVIGNADESKYENLWASCGSDEGNRYKDDDAHHAWDTDYFAANKYTRMAKFMDEYSRLPNSRETWLLNDVSGYFKGCDGDGGLAIATQGLFYQAQAAYMHPRMANYIKGLNGRPCGIVRMDFAGTNYSMTDNDDHEFAASTWGFLLCQAVIRNNFVGKEFKDGKYINHEYDNPYVATEKTNDSEKCSQYAERSETGWVQLWKDGPKYAEFNLGSRIGTYVGANNYDANTIGIPYSVPESSSEYNPYDDIVSKVWGTKWRTPTDEERDLLFNSNKTKIDYIDGVRTQYLPGCTLKGWKISGLGEYANNSIFLPVTEENNMSANGNYQCTGKKAKGPVEYNISYHYESYSMDCTVKTKDMSNSLYIRPVYDDKLGHSGFRDEKVADMYYISNNDELMAFAAFVNGSVYQGHQYYPHPEVNATLTADIDLNGYDFPGIGVASKENTYKGHFNGGNHRILNMQSKHGLFTNIGNGCVIENVIIDSTCVITGDKYELGGLVDMIFCGNTLEDSQEKVDVTIRNCGNEANITNNTSDGLTTAGILGGYGSFTSEDIIYKEHVVTAMGAVELKHTIANAWSYYTLTEHPINKVPKATYNINVNVNISGCYNTGNISIKSGMSSAICGFAGSNVKVSNCWNSGDVAGIESYAYGFAMSSNQLEITNSYGTNNTANVTHVNKEDVSSGHLCYLLNGSTSGSTANGWYQHLASDSHPRPYSVGDDVVYYAKAYKCNVTSTMFDRYANADTIVSIQHVFDNGICTQIAGEEHYEEPSQDRWGKYYIANAGNLYWYAKQYNEDESFRADAMLTDDIIVNKDVIVNGKLTADAASLRRWTPIGNDNGYKVFRNTIDGNGHTISGLYCDEDCAGLIGYAVFDSQIRNIGVIDSYFKGVTFAGAILGKGGDLKGSMGPKLQNCYSTGIVFQGRGASTVNGKYAGGIAGFLSSHPNKDNIINCYSLCSVTGEVMSYRGALFGFLAEQDGTSYTGDLTNCFYQSSKVDANNVVENKYGTEKDSLNFALGEVCHLLNSKSDRQMWIQYIGDQEGPGFGGSGITYQRTVFTKWNTIIMPFELVSDADVEFYTVSSYPSSDTLTLVQQSIVPPNTPCFFRLNVSLDDDGTRRVTFRDNNNSFVMPTETSYKTEVYKYTDDWTKIGDFEGTYVSKMLGHDPATNRGILFKNSFYFASESLIKPFHVTPSIEIMANFKEAKDGLGNYIPRNDDIDLTEEVAQ